MQFFMLNPAMLLGLLLLFWFGFEWGFIPVFLSLFIIGFYSHLEYYWAILFAVSFVFGLGIFALVYQCLNIRYDLRSVASFAVFVFTSFVAATASSLGSFIWSLAHDLSAADTATLWNGWWTGSFLQSLVIVGPLLFILSPAIERKKRQWFAIESTNDVSTRWVYSAVIITTLIIAVFIYSGDYLAKNRLAEEIAGMKSASQDAVLTSMESFEIITWVSIWIILCVGLGAVFLIGSWNKELQRKVEERTQDLKKAEKEVKSSLDEKVVLLKEIHHRVKNNLAVVTALLDLQYMRAENEEVKHILSDAKTRVKSMAFVHETLYQTENFSKIDLELYLGRVCRSIETALKPERKDISMELKAKGVQLEMNKAIPLGLVLNEVLVNAFKHAFKGKKNGNIEINLHQENKTLRMMVSDDGIGLNGNIDPIESKSLGMTLINTLSKQLNAQVSFESEAGKTQFSLMMNLN